MSADRPDDTLTRRVVRLESALLALPVVGAMAMLILSLVVPAWTTHGSRPSTVRLLTAPFELTGRTGIAPRLQSTYAMYGVGIAVLLVVLGAVLWFLLATVIRRVGPRLGAIARIATVVLLVGSLMTRYVVLTDAASAESFQAGAAVYLLPLGTTAALVVAWGLRWLWSPGPGLR